MVTDSFSCRLAHRIWKVRVDERNGFLAVETRDADTHAAYISVIGYRTKRALFKNRPLPGGWNYTADEIAGGFVFVTGFVSANSPERKGIIALDARSGEIVWEKHHLALEYAGGDGLAVYNPMMTPKRLTYLTFAGEPKADEPLINGRDILVPEIGDEAATVVYGDKTISAYYSKSAEGIDHRIRITSGDLVLAEDFLEKNIQKMNPEPFFITGNTLAYIRDRVEIVTYLL